MEVRFPLPYARKSEVVVRRFSVKMVFLKFRNIRRKTPVLESLFNKVEALKACNFIKERLQHRCFHVSTYLGTSILNKFSERLLLESQPCPGLQLY